MSFKSKPFKLISVPNRVHDSYRPFPIFKIGCTAGVGITIFVFNIRNNSYRVIGIGVCGVVISSVSEKEGVVKITKWTIFFWILCVIGSIIGWEVGKLILK